MTNEELVKRCASHGVAGEGDVEHVVRLLHDLMPRLLQRGHAVDIRNFGSFRTRVSGVKRFMRLPQFDPEERLTARVNERFAGLDYIVTSRYSESSVLGGPDYAGPEAPFDPRAADPDRPRVLDTFHDLPAESYRSVAATVQGTHQHQEETTMPRLNLRDDSMESESEPLDSESSSTTPPTLRDVGDGGSKGSPLLLYILLGILGLAIALFALNYFKVINLWGKKTADVAETMPEPEIPSTEETPMTEGEPESLAPSTPLPDASQIPEADQPAATAPEPAAPAATAPAKAAPIPSSGTGTYTVQVSSWETAAKANAEVSKLSAAGYTAFVEESIVDGITRYRVRVGRYDTESEAQRAAAQLADMSEGAAWVARVGR